MIRFDRTSPPVKTRFDWSLAILIVGSIAYAGAVVGLLVMYPNLLN